MAHIAIEDAWSAQRDVGLFACVGTGHPTPETAQLEGGRLRVTSAPATYLEDSGLRGDGTVPAISAVPIEFDEARTSPHPVAARHGPLAGDDVVERALRRLAARPREKLRDGGTRPATLGLDLRECYSTEPVTVRALLPAGAALAAPPRCRLRPLNTRGADRWVDLEADGPAWVAPLGSLTEGMWDLRVTAEGLPGAHDRFAVFEL